MDDSKVLGDISVRPEDGSMLRLLSGAAVVREIHTRRTGVHEHQHDCVTLTIPLSGGFDAYSDIGVASIRGASAVLHPAGSVHAAMIYGSGLEALGLYFDPHWLRVAGLELKLDRTCYWTGGRAGACARALARRWMAGNSSEATLAEVTVRLLSVAAHDEPPPKPRWLDHVDAALSTTAPAQVREIAGKLNLHPAWLNQAYRAVKGEGISEALRRRRIEIAIASLRGSDAPLAQVAIEAGFCDQSHMNRAFRELIGRTPLQVRRDLPSPGGHLT